VGWCRATLALVADLWPPARRGTPLGVVGAVQELGSVLGPLLGAAVLAVADWRAIFWLNVVLGTVIAVALILTADRQARPHLRWLPTVLGLLTLAAGMLTLIAAGALASDVILGVPFVPFAGTSRPWHPDGSVHARAAAGDPGRVWRHAGRLGNLVLPCCDVSTCSGPCVSPWRWVRWS